MKSLCNDFLAVLIATAICCGCSNGGDGSSGRSSAKPSPEKPVVDVDDQDIRTPSVAPSLVATTDPQDVSVRPTTHPEVVDELPFDPADPLSREWQRLTTAYVASVNEWSAKDRIQMDSGGPFPNDSERSALAERVLEQVRRANRDGQIDGLRSRFAPAHQPFLSHFKDKETTLPKVWLLDDGRILLQIGATWREPEIVLIDGQSLNWRKDIATIGRSPNRRYFAQADADGVTIRDGWDGPQISHLNWPTGLEGLPSGYRIAAPEFPDDIEQLIPFPDGRRCLLVATCGVFVLSEEAPVRLLPARDEILKTDVSEVQELVLDLPNGAVSPDGDWIAVSHRDGRHLVFDARLAPVAQISAVNDEPHYAIFSSDSRFLALNGMHYGGGGTIGIATEKLPGLDSRDPETDRRLTLLDDEHRVNCGASRQSEFIIGNKYGDLVAFNQSGQWLWDHAIGSSVLALDISTDGKRLVATTFAGVLVDLELDTGRRNAATIGNSTHRESRRWLFWEDEPQPLAW
jgi:hypothetical protein